MTIDLHTHSSASDGTDSPAQLYAAAHAVGVDTVAITDHDTAAGWEAAVAALPAGMSLVRGAELSTHIVAEDRHYSIHLLAYLFDPTAPGIARELARLRSDRLERGMLIVDRMVAAGLPISREQVLDIAAGAPVGRPHIGRALMAAGLVESVTEAFAGYLSGRGPYYVAKSDTLLADGIELVRAAGGVPVVAHPRSRGARHLTDDAFFRRYADLGLGGIEVGHPDHDDADAAELAEIAARYGLIATGSSDYHGSNKPVLLGTRTTAADQLERLVAASAGAVPIVAGA